jgi:hypothetical protein
VSGFKLGCGSLLIDNLLKPKTQTQRLTLIFADYQYNIESAPNLSLRSFQIFTSISYLCRPFTNNGCGDLLSELETWTASPGPYFKTIIRQSFSKGGRKKTKQ